MACSVAVACLHTSHTQQTTPTTTTAFNLKLGVQKTLAAHAFAVPIEHPDTARRVVRAMSTLHRDQGFTFGMVAHACLVHPSNFNEWLNHSRRPTIGPKVIAFLNACSCDTVTPLSPTQYLPTTTTKPLPETVVVASMASQHQQHHQQQQQQQQQLRKRHHLHNNNNNMNNNNNNNNKHLQYIPSDSTQRQRQHAAHKIARSLHMHNIRQTQPGSPTSSEDLDSDHEPQHLDASTRTPTSPVILPAPFMQSPNIHHHHHHHLDNHDNHDHDLHAAMISEYLSHTQNQSCSSPAHSINSNGNSTNWDLSDDDAAAVALLMLCK